jgi:hypothetical protein
VRKPYYDKDLTGETGPAPIRRENTIFGFSGPEKPLYGPKIDGINASFGAARESISETSSQVTPPSSGESANPRSLSTIMLAEEY